MKYQKDRMTGKKAGIALGAAALVFCGAAGSLRVGAAQTVDVSSKEYDLSVEDLPEGVEKAYAKFHDGSLSADGYMLSLFDGYDAMIAIEEALTAAGEELADLEYQAFEATVYEKDEEGDYYPLDGMQGITLICPLPEGFVENAGQVQVTAVDSKGALCRISSKIVKAGGKDCAMFDLSVFTTYAFVYKSSGTLTAGKQPTPTPAAAKPTQAPKPTNKPDSTVTKAPTKTPEKPAAPTSTPQKPEETKPEKKPTPVPTKAPAKAGATAGSSSSATASSSRDKTPQTGDDFQAGRYFAALAAGGMLVGLGFFIGHKKK